MAIQLTHSTYCIIEHTVWLIVTLFSQQVFLDEKSSVLVRSGTSSLARHGQITKNLQTSYFEHYGPRQLCGALIAKYGSFWSHH